jgi:hypothetical protein
MVVLSLLASSQQQQQHVLLFLLIIATPGTAPTHVSTTFIIAEMDRLSRMFFFVPVLPPYDCISVVLIVFFFLPQFSVDSAYKAGSNSKLVYASLR